MIPHSLITAKPSYGRQDGSCSAIPSARHLLLRIIGVAYCTRMW